ncbi:MAG: zinc-binding alcohol dehydrogenase [Actinomycetota bacterium]|nr:zinc-binding alcohol dehydrogenase [Actinomycetota bacterium]
MPDRLVRTLGVAGSGRPAFFEVGETPPQDGEFWVQTWYSGLSAGTELSFIKGTNPFFRHRWDRDLRLFCDGVPAQHYPVPCLGYMEVGQVTDSRTAVVAEGTTVAMAFGHRTGFRADPSRDHHVVLPDGLDPLLGIYLAQMGPICANGLLHAAAEVVGEVRTLSDGVAGRHVLITGAGVVGLLTGLFAAHYGAAHVAVADSTEKRLHAAHALGLEPIDDNEHDPAVWCKQRWRHGPGDRGADVAFQCRGRAGALRTALRALRPQGAVIDLAFYQNGASEVCLGEEFHHNGLAIRCAQIARVPRTLVGSWTQSALSEQTLVLLQTRGTDIQQHLITDMVPFAEAPDFLADLATRRRQTLQAVFTFPGQAAPA